MITQHSDFQAWHGGQGWRRRKGLNFEISAASTWPAESDMGVLVPGVGGAPSWADTGTLRSLIPKSQGGGPAITTVKETAEDMLAGYQADYGTVKKESFVSLLPVTVPTVTIAHYCRVPDQLIEDIGSFEAFIEQRLRLGLVRKEEQELANGTGATTGFGTLQGLLPIATEVTPPTGTNVNAADIVQAAILEVQGNGFSPDAIVCAPSFWGLVGGLKSTMGEYLIPALPSASAPMSLWGVRAYVSSALAGLANFIVGDFANGSRLFVAKTVTIDISMHDLDNFTKNLLTIRAELREAHVVYNAKAYVKQTASVGGTSQAQERKPASK
jgi:HK97 family phage major capsid protein